jgi:uncharacterized Rossmann fold enzyme
MQPLRLLVSTYGSDEANGANIESAKARGLPELIPALCSHDGHFVIAGSGPSLPDFLPELKAEQIAGRPICAVNGAYDFLVDNDIIPNFFLTVDPRPMPQNVTKPQHETIFLLASRANPELFDRLQGFNIMLWHSYGNLDEAKYYQGSRAVYGGASTSGLRAITIAYIMGFRNISLYGLDSCLAADRITKRFTGEHAGQVIDVIVGDRTFYCNGAMAQQAKEIQEYPQFLEGLHLDIKGDGLLAAIWAERKRLGYPI